MCATQVKPGAESKPASVSAQQATSPAASAKPVIQSPQGREFWPGGARLVISISMQFEAGG